MSKIEVNTIEPQCGTTLTLGASGDTVALASGASQTGFGRTGTVDWVTTVQTSGFTAANGKGYFVNTTGGAISVNLPAGSAGSIVAFKDYAKTWDTNNLTLVQNGSDKIGSSTVNAILSTEGGSLTLVFVDSTQGWLVVNDGVQEKALTAQFISATGGNTVTTSGDYKIHTFTSPGTFTVCSVGNACGSTKVDYLIAAGGGGGGTCIGGGGGAGGLRASNGTSSGSYCAGPGPLTNPVCGSTVSAQGYPIVVGAGGAGSTSPSTPGNATAGSASSFNSISAAGGGLGATYGMSGGNGGSGGGAGGWTTQPGPSGGGTAAGSGNTPPVSPPQGNNGGSNSINTQDSSGAGGGGATAVGTNSTSSPPRTHTSPGGAGLTSLINGSPVEYSKGGDGKGDSAPGAADGVANTGEGGDGAGSDSPGNGKAGGSGIVIIRYRYQ
jgi:hypothetical protein